ncbi:MAG: tryptophan--tRNA ligase [Candidatus Moraniibacteriota bacterium]
MKKGIFSGIKPSGNLHIGNYLGAINQWLALQADYEALFCVVDLHAITVPQEPATLRAKTLEIAKIYLAAGIDPNKCTLFVQSHVPQHTELAWILNTLAMMGELGRMTQYKDKTNKNVWKKKDGTRQAMSESEKKKFKDNVSVGIFDYPVLMAADILLYDTQVVPVGDDQSQHIELARTLARRFNKRFGDTFVVPEPKIQQEGARIMGLDDPTKKMSKSAASEYNFIALTDDAETVQKKIKKAVTDSGSEVVYAEDKPALKNLINIYSLLSDQTPQAVEALYSGKGYGEFKEGLADVIIHFLTPFQGRFNALSDDEVLRTLQSGAEKAKQLASQKMQVVREKVGLLGL